MSFRRLMTALALALCAARCADHPTAAVPSSAAGPHFLHWATKSAPQFKASGAALASPLSLDQYTVSFWAVRGQSRSVQLNYRDVSGDTSHPFLILTISDPEFVPDSGAPAEGDSVVDSTVVPAGDSGTSAGGDSTADSSALEAGHALPERFARASSRAVSRSRALAEGDSVLVTLSIDTTKIGVLLEPTGLRFGTPARLQISYDGAGGDLNGDGVVDETDSYIESQLLSMWYREGSDGGWEQIAAEHLIEDKVFIVDLPHFSEYAVSW
jgi:hypothetical protein